jgi:hypothetical protein
MTKYRIVFISSRGQSFGFRDLAAADHADAIRWARKTFSDVDMEIRCNDCTVAMINKDTGQTVTA